MITVILLLALTAFALTVAHAGWGKPPLWVAVLLLVLIELLRLLPLGR